MQLGGDGHGVDAAVAEAAAADERRRVFLEQGLPTGFIDYARMGRQRADALGEGLLPDSAARRIFLEDVRATIQATQLKALGADGLNGPFLSMLIADDDEALERFADLCLLMADGFLPPKAAEALGISILVPIPKAKGLTEDELDEEVAKFQNRRDAAELEGGSTEAPQDPATGAQNDDLKARGICVPRLLGRIVERLLMRRNAAAIARAMGPAQLCTTRNAAEILTHVTTLTLEAPAPTSVMVIWDAKQGYDRIKLGHVLAHQHAHVQKLTPYNRMLYCGAKPPVAVYYRRDGSVIEFPCAALEQGRGLSPANFGFGTAKALLDMVSRFPATSPLAYVDDNRLGGDIGSVAAALHAVYAQDGLYAASGILPKE